MKLQKYLKENDISIHAFCVKTEIARHVIMRAIQGEEIYLSMACKIEKATKGAVTLQELFPTKLRSKLVSPIATWVSNF